MERFLTPNKIQKKQKKSLFSSNSSKSNISQEISAIKEEFLIDYYTDSVPKEFEKSTSQRNFKYNNIDFKGNLNKAQLKIIKKINEQM